MRSFIVALIGTVIGAAASASDDTACLVSGHLVQADFALPRAVAAIEKKRLDIVVIGSGSSMLGGPSGASKAYPARLEAALARLLPGVVVRVNTYVKPREIAAEMKKHLERVLLDEKPALVVWQAGTADAIRGKDPDEFRMALADGVNASQAAGSDVIFMNMQYSPRTESMIALGAYADAMRFVALQHEIILFDRFAIMKHWNEVGVFDLTATTKKTDTAERVHECIGQLLAGLVVEATKLTGPGNTGSNR